MKRAKLMLGTLVLGLGLAGAAWAQPAPSHDRDAAVQARYSRRGEVTRGDRDDAWRGDRQYNMYQRGDNDGRYGAWNVRGDRDDHNVRRGDDNDARGARNWGHSYMRRGDRDDR